MICKLHCKMLVQAAEVLSRQTMKSLIKLMKEVVKGTVISATATHQVTLSNHKTSATFSRSWCDVMLLMTLTNTITPLLITALPRDGNCQSQCELCRLCSGKLVNSGALPSNNLHLPHPGEVEEEKEEGTL